MVKIGGKSRKLAFDWDKEVAGQNTYELVGCSNLGNEAIAAKSEHPPPSLRCLFDQSTKMICDFSVDDYGSYYNIAFNNCRHVTTNLARELCSMVSSEHMQEYASDICCTMLDHAGSFTKTPRYSEATENRPGCGIPLK
jgi:hypothetical protein